MPAAAPAAATEAPIQEVVVTGSRIARADAEAAVNVEVISAPEIKESGQATMADYLRTIFLDVRVSARVAESLVASE